MFLTSNSITFIISVFVPIDWCFLIIMEKILPASLHADCF